MDSFDFFVACTDSCTLGVSRNQTHHRSQGGSDVLVIRLHLSANNPVKGANCIEFLNVAFQPAVSTPFFILYIETAMSLLLKVKLINQNLYNLIITHIFN